VVAVSSGLADAADTDAGNADATGIGGEEAAGVETEWPSAPARLARP
jgi:hypothetical protein